MRVHVVSDVHGNVDALARAGDGADALVVLGDLIDFIDYADHSGGILGRLFGAEKVATFVTLRSQGDRDALAAFSRSLWSSLHDPKAAVDDAIREQYTALFHAMTAPTFATPGNVDSPQLWHEFAGDGIEVLDGEVAKIGGLRFGFVGGGVVSANSSQASRGEANLDKAPENRRVSTPGWRPYLRRDEDIGDALSVIGEVDVLCSHVPPDIADLTYDVVARGAERGSTSLLEYIHRNEPRWSVFGHVHQPLSARRRVGKTECRNVGYFKRNEYPYVLRW